VYLPQEYRISFKKWENYEYFVYTTYSLEAYVLSYLKKVNKNELKY